MHHASSLFYAEKSALIKPLRDKAVEQETLSSL